MGKIFVVALVMDTVYQLIVFHWIYATEAIVTAVILALVPYILLRGPINRLAGLGPTGSASRPL